MAHLRASRYGGQGRGLLIVGACVLVSACASTGAVYTPHPFPMPGGRNAPVAAPATADPASAPIAAASPPAVPPPGTKPGAPPQIVPSAAAGDGYALSGTALSLRGAPYKNGGIDPNGFDCSGFVRYVYAQHGVTVPREVRDQFKVGKKVDRDRLEPGDLVFFSTVAPGASHVGIVIGGDQFVHAPSEKGVVRVESLSQPYWGSRYIGAKRVN